MGWYVLRMAGSKWFWQYYRLKNKSTLSYEVYVQCFKAQLKVEFKDWTSKVVQSCNQNQGLYNIHVAICCTASYEGKSIAIECH